MNKIDKKQRDRARRGPSLEEDVATAARVAELKETAKLKNAPPGPGQLAALAAKFGTTLKRLK
jgi:hypothetical protein